METNRGICLKTHIIYEVLRDSPLTVHIKGLHGGKLLCNILRRSFVELEKLEWKCVFLLSWKIAIK